MSIMAKMEFAKQIETELMDKLTSSELSKVLSIMSDTLGEYDIEKLQRDKINIDKDDLLNIFLSALRVQGRSEKTIERYNYSLKRMLSFVNVPTRQVTVHHLRNYLSNEKERGISDRTIEGNRQVYSSYFNWLHREGLIQVNPIANLGSIKCKKKVKTIYSDVEIERLRRQCHEIRDRAIIEFMISTGCRVSEMTQLNRQDVDLINGECKVLGKGSKERTVYLNQIACMVLKQYFDSRTDDYEALFIGKGTNRITPHGVRAVLNRIAEELNITNVHPHKFRRTFATNLIRHGMPIQDVATILGHDKLDTTMEYVVIDKAEIKHAYRKYA